MAVELEFVVDGGAPLVLPGQWERPAGVVVLGKPDTQGGVALVWTATPSSRVQLVEHCPGEGMLSSFLRTVQDGRIQVGRLRSFAMQWGTLGESQAISIEGSMGGFADPATWPVAWRNSLGKAGFAPVIGSSVYMRRSKDPDGQERLDVITSGAAYLETGAAWVRWVTEAHAIANIGRSLRRGELGDPNDWNVALQDRQGSNPDYFDLRNGEIVWNPGGLRVYRGKPADPDFMQGELMTKADLLGWQRAELANCINAWLRRTGASVAATWNPQAGVPELRVGGTSMLSGIGFELLMMLSISRELAVCTHCGNVFMKNPKQHSPRVFCKSCRDDGVRSRYTSRDARRRKKVGDNGEAEGQGRG